MGVGFVEPDGAAGVGADLGEGDHVADGPALPAGAGPVLARGQADQQGLGVGGVGVAFGEHGEHAADGHVPGADGVVVFVDDPGAAPPRRAEQRPARPLPQ